MLMMLFSAGVRQKRVGALDHWQRSAAGGVNCTPRLSSTNEQERKAPLLMMHLQRACWAKVSTRPWDNNVDMCEKAWTLCTFAANPNEMKAVEAFNSSWKTPPARAS